MTDHHDADEHLLKKRLLTLTIVIVVLSLIGTAVAIWPAYYQNYAPDQPIPFSHRLHAGQYEIPCLYCHGSAEYAQFAAAPGTETCMNCHSQVKTDSPWIQQIKQAHDTNTPIPWVKVHVLPDFVYFNHSRHVAAGLECQTCHGPVQSMEKVYQFEKFTMGWCVNCHRNDDYLTEDRKNWAAAKEKLQGDAAMPEMLKMLAHPEIQNADLSCSTCHR
jgi:hypothetical protein